MIRFGKRGKLLRRYIKPFEILERVGTVAYRLALPPSLSGVDEIFHVSMPQKYTSDPTHVVDWGELIVNADGTFEEGPMCIMDSQDQGLRDSRNFMYFEAQVSDDTWSGATWHDYVDATWQA